MVSFVTSHGFLCVRLVLEVLSDKDSRDYACVIKVDEEFETTVYKLRAYFGFFKRVYTCETILCFYSYDGAVNYVKCKTGGLQGESTGIHGFLSHYPSPLGKYF